jgi:hypothetical protein
MQSKCKLHGTPVMQSSEMLASILGAIFGRAALARRGCCGGRLRGGLPPTTGMQEDSARIGAGTPASSGLWPATSASGVLRAISKFEGLYALIPPVAKPPVELPNHWNQALSRAGKADSCSVKGQIGKQSCVLPG